MRKIIQLIIVQVMISTNAFSGGQIPPELPPFTPDAADEATIEQQTKAKSKPECGPAKEKEYVEGKCMCEKTTTLCKPKVITKTVEKKVYVDKPVIKTVEKPVVQYKTVDKIVEKTVERVVEKAVGDRHTILFHAGIAPDGIETVLVERRDGRKKYEFYQAEGNIVAIQYIFGWQGLGVNWKASALWSPTNDTRLGAVGFSFK